eukprot:CAMPEP_0171117290 /NCGR_PEP_ID=MMETSP0766_2-20121228/92150_1 /TAXON_ID=439317 /ORGANISM="Gambierdiscus australes, Strain CAWD 149" /LENGTH=132 /DNA_ID=CAMNT_0011579789 /DNA_START=286 /DNA_END=685 /DNA_ORIENTATION=+
MKRPDVAEIAAPSGSGQSLERRHSPGSGSGAAEAPHMPGMIRMAPLSFVSGWTQKLTDSMGGGMWQSCSFPTLMSECSGWKAASFPTTKSPPPPMQMKLGPSSNCSLSWPRANMPSSRGRNALQAASSKYLT